MRISTLGLAKLFLIASLVPGTAWRFHLSSSFSPTSLPGS